MINLEKMRLESITIKKLIDSSVEKIGYIVDEVSYNYACTKFIIDSKYFYIYSGSYLPNRKLKKETIIVDFYNNLKPWDVSIKGYEVFEKYIEYYNSVCKLIEIEYTLPKSIPEICENLKNKGYQFLDIYPIKHPLIGEYVYRISWFFKKLLNIK